MQAWIASWCSPQAAGGAPGKGTTDAHGVILQSWHHGARAYIQQDLSAYFDSIRLPQLLTILDHMRAPPCLGRLLASFYSGSLRLFKVSKVTSERWQTSSKGLLQGCPLSPLCALLIGNVWHAYVTRGPTKALIFVDDRLLWAPPGARDVEAALADGLTRSNFFDNVMNFTCRPSKCAIVEPQARPQLHALAAQLGYPTRRHLEILGLTVELDSGKTGLLKLSVNTLQSRLRALNILNPLSTSRGPCVPVWFSLLWHGLRASLLRRRRISLPSVSRSTEPSNLRRDPVGPPRRSPRVAVGSQMALAMAGPASSVETHKKAVLIAAVLCRLSFPTPTAPSPT